MPQQRTKDFDSSFPLLKDLTGFRARLIKQQDFDSPKVSVNLKHNETCQV